MKQTIKKILAHILSPEQFQKAKDIYHWFISRNISGLQKMIAEQSRLEKITDGKKVSILCCCFNTNEKYLTEMLESVEGQRYQNWELLLLNCSDSKHPGVEKILNSYAQKDSRFKIFHHENQGISLNSQYISQYAEGEYLLLLDHDDLLLPSSIADMMQCAKEHQADFVYADELYLFTCGYALRRKKDYSLKRLWRGNYINHPALIRKTLFEKAGGFRAGYDGSQDYDLYLRLVEKTSMIFHIPGPLYVWRIHTASFSQDSMNRCIDSGKRALEDHLARTGVEASVIPRQNIAIFKVKLK